MSEVSNQGGGAEQAGGQLRPLALGLAGAGALVRLLPHFWNMTPMTGVSIFSGARLRGWRAFAVPLGLMAFTDLVLWAAKGDRPFNPWVYGTYAVCILLGRLLGRTQSAWKVGGVALLASLLFFAVTNFGCWLGSSLYPQNVGGLLACYAAALPFYGADVPPPLGFFGNAVLGDLFFTAALFAAHALLTRYWFAAERVRPTAAAE